VGETPRRTCTWITSTPTSGTSARSVAVADLLHFLDSNISGGRTRRRGGSVAWLRVVYSSVCSVSLVSVDPFRLAGQFLSNWIRWLNLGLLLGSSELVISISKLMPY
jgi:hypothetical protein